MSSSRSSTTEQTSTNPSSTAESGETEEGSNSAIAPGSEQASRRASAVSEAADGAAPMQVIPEEAPMDETSDGTTPANAESMPSRSFGPSLTERMRRGPYTPPQILRSDDVLLDQPETPTMTRTSVTEPAPLFGNCSVTSPNPRTPYPFHAGTRSLPRPPGHSFFLEVIDFDNDSAEVAGQASMAFVGATWRFDREVRRTTLQPYTDDGVSFAKSEAEASYILCQRSMHVCFQGQVFFWSGGNFQSCLKLRRFSSEPHARRSWTAWLPQVRLRFCP